jgi:hypothetical protein
MYNYFFIMHFLHSHTLKKLTVFKICHFFIIFDCYINFAFLPDIWFVFFDCFHLFHLYKLKLFSYLCTFGKKPMFFAILFKNYRFQYTKYTYFLLNLFFQKCCCKIKLNKMWRKMHIYWKNSGQRR